MNGSHPYFLLLAPFVKDIEDRTELADAGNFSCSHWKLP